MSINNLFKVSLPNILIGALKENNSVIWETARRIIHSEVPCPSCQHIEDFGQEPIPEDSKSCGSTPSKPTKELQWKFRSFTSFADCVTLTMMTGIISLENKMATLTGMV
ncbi:hypothetical protein LIER_34882 [Lithospermum erythrorhizon]|uniref:Transposase n=1 Tax=Lithospermum erythrorhizon TaxID=34254 RepID=A0AAV3S3P0_LITER